MTWRPRDPEMLLPHGLRRTVVTVLTAIAAIPVLFMLLMSVTPDRQVASGALWPAQFSWSNYREMWSTVSLGSGLLNSLLAALAAAGAATLLAVGAAYCLTRFTFLGRRPFLAGLVLMQSLPQSLLMLPLVVVFSSLGNALGIAVIGSRAGLIVTYLTFALPLATWIMVTHLRGIPGVLEEAGLVDGLSRFGTLRRIVLPLAWPGMVVSLVFSFLLGWNDVLYASILTGPDSRTAAVQLMQLGQSIEGGSVPLYGQLMGASVVCAVPVVVLYLFFQRQLAGGIAGGVKG